MSGSDSSPRPLGMLPLSHAVFLQTPLVLSRGFTLVESLICICIILVLVCLLIPAVGMLTAHTRAATTQLRLRELEAAFELYQGEEPRHLYPTPRADGMLSWDPSDALGCGTALAAVGFQPAAGEIGRDPTSPAYLRLTDAWGRPFFYQLDGPYVDATGHLVSSMMTAPPVRPAAVSDWNPAGTKPFAYLWSMGLPGSSLAADSLPAHVSQWLYRHSAP